MILVVVSARDVIALVANGVVLVDVMTKLVAGTDSGSSIVLSLDSGSIGFDPKLNSYEESE
jgi:hypothetical protein